MKRVGFIVTDQSDGWLGGLSYRRNLMTAILANRDRRIEPVLIIPPTMPESRLVGFPDMEIVHDSLAKFPSFKRRIGQVSCQLIGRDLTLERVMKRRHIDLLSHSFPVGSASRLPSIDWIPDFQHVRMPRSFSLSDRARRDATYRRLIDGSRLVLVSSADAGRDLKNFAPDVEAKIRVLHFVSGFQNLAAPISRTALEQHFGFSGLYFYVPNQFWAHKNHGVIIEALAILKQRNVDVLVLASGKTHDSRDPSYFNRLIARAIALGVSDRFRVLGVVGLPELMGLMLNSIALINPSNFEGWSTTVEESKALGLPMILSNIPVHVEQAPRLGRYFAADSADALADTMATVLREHDPAAAAPMREAAAAEMPERIRAFGRRFEDIALEAIQLSC